MPSKGTVHLQRVKQVHLDTGIRFKAMANEHLRALREAGGSRHSECRATDRRSLVPVWQFRRLVRDALANIVYNS